MTHALGVKTTNANSNILHRNLSNIHQHFNVPFPFLEAIVYLALFIPLSVLMSTPQMVPDWLVGLWHRDYIKRRVLVPKEDDGNILGPPQSHVQVWYLQTPYAFIDVRRAPGTKEEAMAFAGVTTAVEVEQNTTEKDPLVKWHACLDLLDPLSDATERWEQADRATPKPTEDEGFFARLQENLYRETDPAKTLEEQWARQHDGSNQ